MTELSRHQIEALDLYDRLQVEHTELFSARDMRPIVTSRAQLEAYAEETGKVLGVAAQTDYFLFINDLVQPSEQRPFVYSRLVSVGQLKGGTNVAILATIADAALGEPGSIVLIEQERHATGRIEVAIPRGFADPDCDGPTAAKRELREESGYTGTGAELIGESVIDSGAGDARVSFYRIRVTGRLESSPEVEEAIRNVRLMTPDELEESIRGGSNLDSFTLQALFLAGLCRE